MKIIVAPDSFKGTFSAAEITKRLTEALENHFTGPDGKAAQCHVIGIPLADGGEGTAGALVAALGGSIRQTQVAGPLGSDQPVAASWGLYEDKALMDMASAAGLTLLEPSRQNPELTTTYGVGELILAALDEGVKEIIIGIGGSATNDGGMGMATALGVRFLDGAGEPVGQGGGCLCQIERIDASGLDPRLKTVKVTVMCDVDNPLTGPKGAAHVYSPQKGADPEQVLRLEAGLCHYEALLKDYCGFSVGDIPGAGAAGGLGAGLMAFAGGRLRSGIDVLLDLVHFDEIAADADLVITGEGRIDGQSCHGKVPVGVARRCKDLRPKVIALAGTLGEGAEQVYAQGIDAVVSTVSAPMSVTESLDLASENLDRAIDSLIRLLRVGMSLGPEIQEKAEPSTSKGGDL